MKYSNTAAFSHKANQELAWQNILRTLDNNLVMVLATLKEDFGFGEERLNRFFDGFYGRTEEFRQMVLDDVYEEKTENYHLIIGRHMDEIAEMYSLRLLPPSVRDRLYGKIAEPAHVIAAQVNARQRSRAEKQKISLVQAQQMQEQLQAAKSWAQNNSGYNAAVGRMMKDDE